MTRRRPEPTPRFATPPTPGRRNRGAQIAAAALSFGKELMPYQRMIANIATEMLDDNRPAYPEVTISVARQNGKSLLSAAFLVERCLFRDSPQTCVFTSTSGKTAREKFIEDFVPLFTAPTVSLAQGIERVHRANGSEGLTFTGGSRIAVLPGTEDAGMGMSLDLVIADEIWQDVDDRREQNFRPTMITRPQSQIIWISTAGTPKSVLLRRKIDAGRASCADGLTEGVAFFEYAAEDDDNPDDEATWAKANPALDWTVDLKTLRDNHRTMPPAEWARAHLNIWVGVDAERVIPAGIWNLVNSPDVTPTGSLALALEVAPDRSSASIAAADSDGNVELVPWAVDDAGNVLPSPTGIGWVVDRIVEVAKKSDADVVIDGRGPAASLVDAIEAEDVTVTQYSTADMTKACSSFYDGVADQKLMIRRDDSLDLAAASATRRMIGDAWIWSRRDSSADVTPILAATMAYAEAATLDADMFIGAWA